MEPPNSFGEWLRRRRRSFDWTQEELAKRVGCAVGTIRKIEADELRPSKQLAEILAQRLDLPPDTHDDFVRFAGGTLQVEFRIAPPTEKTAHAPHGTAPGKVILPTGTVTFLFTDIEASTTLWQTYPEAMKTALAQHHALLRQAIELHNGYVFQIIGDAFCAAFSDACDAVHSALIAQRELRDATWGETGALRVRMALHTGVAQIHTGDFTSGEYASGLTLSRAARLLSAGHGGQVLLSDATRVLVENDLPAGAALRNLGRQRLKDLEHPEPIYQLVVPDLPADFPLLKTLDILPNNLPIQLTSFIGREKEIRELKQLVHTHRLVTLTGAGGCGKTRLALQTATNLLDDFKDGVWVVELAPLADPGLVPQTVAAVFGLRQEQARPILETVIDFLREKNILLLLDNCEHLIEACAQFADTLLHACPQLKILASSREALGVAGETPYRVPSLQTPNPDLQISAQDLVQYEAVRLFSDRAVTLDPAFAVTNQNAPAVAQICRRLDGIPLALELAAARIKVLSVEQISKKLDDRFKLLTGGSRTALPRQQTLRALIDWSHGLLSEAERILLRRLAVFAGGWTLEAAQAVCSCDPVCADDVLDLLTHLVDKSLVMVETQGDAARYRMIETIRQYARDKLLESGEGERIRTRHLDFFLCFTEAAEPKYHGSAQDQWFERTEIEHDNLRAALEWSTNEGCVERGMRLASALFWFWDKRGDWHEGINYIQQLLKQPEASARTLTRANALLTLVDFLSDLGERNQSPQYIEELISIAREQGDPGKPILALGLTYAGRYLAEDDPVKSQTMIDESLRIVSVLKESWMVGNILLGIGLGLWAIGDYVTALAKFEASLRLYQSSDDKRYAMIVNHFIGAIKFRMGDCAGARRHVERNLDYCRATQDRVGIYVASNFLGEVERNDGKYDLAKRYYLQAIEQGREYGGRTDAAEGNLGFVFLHEGNSARARTLFTNGIASVRKDGIKASIGMFLAGFGGVAALDKHTRRAIILLAASQKMLEMTADKRRLNQVDQAELAHFLALSKEQVDEATFNAAWAEGRAMTMEQAIEYALNESPTP